jgi:hypothetical protein
MERLDNKANRGFGQWPIGSKALWMYTTVSLVLLYAMGRREKHCVVGHVSVTSVAVGSLRQTASDHDSNPLRMLCHQHCCYYYYYVIATEKHDYHHYDKLTDIREACSTRQVVIEPGLLLSISCIGIAQPNLPTKR